MEYHKHEQPSTIFQRRRKRYLRAIVELVVVVIILFVPSLFVDYPEKEWFQLAAFFTFFIGIILFTFITYRWYRCPACKTVPMTWIGGSYGVDLNPYECKKCGAALKEDKKPRNYGV